MSNACIISVVWNTKTLIFIFEAWPDKFLSFATPNNIKSGQSQKGLSDMSDAQQGESSRSAEAFPDLLKS